MARLLPPRLPLAGSRVATMKLQSTKVPASQWPRGGANRPSTVAPDRECRRSPSITPPRFRRRRTTTNQTLMPCWKMSSKRANRNQLPERRTIVWPTDRKTLPCPRRHHHRWHGGYCTNPASSSSTPRPSPASRFGDTAPSPPRPVTIRATTATRTAATATVTTAPPPPRTTRRRRATTSSSPPARPTAPCASSARIRGGS
mmetsp:Transcript_22523/g.47443  ORF Transcript_22523/g.47443 Transcript_22523/m.47443 type:complete len:201 (+) Transcript_22523:120-722(+)